MKKKLFAFLLSAVIILACGCTAGNTLRIGTAGIGGIYNEFGTSLSKLAADNGSLEIDVKTTTGSAANVRLLSKGYIDLAIAQSDIINDAYNGSGTFSKNGAYDGYYAVAGLYTEACQIVVKADSKIESVGDLQDKKVGIGEKESGTEQNAAQILAAYGLSDNMLYTVNLDYTESAKQLASGEIDAFFCTVGANTTIIDELSKQCNIRLLSIDESQASRLKSAYSFYTDCTIPANTYNGQDKDVKTLGVKSVLLANNKVSDEQVEKLTKLIFDHSDDLQYTVSAHLELDEKTAVEGISIPFHKGAAAYYSSKGIEVKTE